MSVRYVRKQGGPIAAMGHASSAVLNTGGGAPPPVLQTGAWSTLYNATGDASSLNFAGLAERLQANPATINVARPAGPNNYAVLIVQGITGQPDYIRTVSSQQPADVRSWRRTYNPVDGSVFICGSADPNAVTIEIRDETGAVLAVANRPDALSGVWGWWAMFDAAGAVTWLRANTFSQPATDNVWQACWCTSIEYATASGRLYMSGGIRKIASETAGGVPIPAGDCVPVIGGVSYPPVTTNINTISGTWVVELDPATGNALNITANDNIYSTNATLRNYVMLPTLLNVGMYLKSDPADGSLFLVSNYTGDLPANNGWLEIGRGAGPINTRPFTSWGGADEVKPYLVKYTANLVPVVVDTVKINIILNQRSMPGGVAISATSLYWSWQEPTTVSPSNVNRDPFAYGNAPTVYSGNGSMNLIKVPKADLGSPNAAGGFNLGLSNPSSSQVDNSKVANMQVSADGTKVFVSMTSLKGTNTGTWDFLDDPTPDAWRILQTQLACIDAVTGTQLWRARERPRGANDHAQSSNYEEAYSGPNVGKLYSVVYYGVGAATNPDVGPEDTDGTLAYNLRFTWPTNQNPFDGAFFVIVRDSTTGDVIPAECYPLMSCDRQEPGARLVDFGLH